LHANAVKNKRKLRKQYAGLAQLVERYLAKV
jgi:hypothetical protein